MGLFFIALGPIRFNKGYVTKLNIAFKTIKLSNIYRLKFIRFSTCKILSIFLKLRV